MFQFWMKCTSQLIRYYHLLSNEINYELKILPKNQL